MEATRKHPDILVATDPGLKDFQAGWIHWKDEKKKAPDTAVAVAAPIMPKVVIFDETSGTTEVMQDEHAVKKESKGDSTEGVQWIETPWRYWLKTDLAETQVEQSLDHAAITYVLNMLHLRANHLGNAIDVLMTPQGNVTKVVAAETLGEETLSLLPCVPHSLKFFSESVHPCRVPIIVKKKWRLLGRQKDLDLDWREKTYYIHPEWIPPRILEKEDVSSGSTQSCADRWEMEWHGKESMHPFWAVDRVVGAKDEAQNKKKRKHVNCILNPKEYQLAGVGSSAGDSVGVTTTVVVPELTNSEMVEKGQELVLEGWTKAEERKSQKRTWKSAQMLQGRKKMNVMKKKKNR